MGVFDHEEQNEWSHAKGNVAASDRLRLDRYSFSGVG